jgi:hypothetical protein
MTELMRLPNLVRVNGSVTIRDSAFLASINGLSSLTYIGGGLSVYVYCHT